MTTLPLASVADRAMVLTNMLTGLAGMHTARPNMHIEWDGNDSPVIVRQTDGWTTTTGVWAATLTDLDADVIVADTDGNIQVLPPMKALVFLHNVIMRDEYRA